MQVESELEMATNEIEVLTRRIEQGTIESLSSSLSRLHPRQLSRNNPWQAEKERRWSRFQAQVCWTSSHRPLQRRQ